LASVCPIYGKSLAKKFKNGNVIGNTDFSIRNPCFQSIFYPYVSIFDVWQLKRFFNGKQNGGKGFLLIHS